MENARKNVHTAKMACREVRLKYKATEEILGSGAFGTVMLFKDRKNPDQNVAVKIVRKEKVKNERALEIMKDEIGIMTLFNHKHVIKHIESFDDERHLIIVMEALVNTCELDDVFNHYKIN